MNFPTAAVAVGFRVQSSAAPASSFHTRFPQDEPPHVTLVFGNEQLGGRALVYFTSGKNPLKTKQK